MKGQHRPRAPGLAMIAATIAILVAACGTVATPAATPAAHSATIAPSPSLAPSPWQTPAASASASLLPGFILVVSCDESAQPNEVCLGDGTTVDASAVHGGMLGLSLNVKNNGATPSSLVSLLLHAGETGTLPFGPPTCATCNTSATQHAFGLEWPPLAPGEMRTLTAHVPITADAGKTLFLVDLYAESLVDLITNTTVDGFQPGERSWTVALTVGG